MLVYIAYLIFFVSYQCLKRDSITFISKRALAPPAPSNERQEGRRAECKIAYDEERYFLIRRVVRESYLKIWKQCEKLEIWPRYSDISNITVPSLSIFRQTPIYTFYRTFRQGSNTFKDFFYWAFYPYNQGKRVCLGASIKGRCVGKCHWFGHHVGDWEHVTIRLKNNLPFAMYISAHNFGGKYNYDNYRGTFVRGSTLP